MDLNRASLIFMLVFLVVRTSCKYKVRLRGKELDLHGIRGLTHLENKKTIKKYETIGRSALMNPDADKTLDREIDERLKAKNGELICEDSCDADLSNDTESPEKITESPEKITERAADLNESGNTTSDTEIRNPMNDHTTEESSTKENVIILTLHGEDGYSDSDSVDAIEDNDYEETTHHPEQTTVPARRARSRTKKVINKRKPWFVPKFAIGLGLIDIPVSHYEVVPEAKIGQKCDFQLFNESTGYLFDTLFSKRVDEWSEDEDEQLLFEYEAKLFNYSTTDDTTLNTICLNDYNFLSCHKQKHTCYCGSHGYLHLEQQLGIGTCTARLGYFCDYPYIICSEDFDCVNRTCTVHNYNSAKALHGHRAIFIILFVLPVRGYLNLSLL